MYEKKLLGEMKQNYNPYNADYESLYKLRSVGNAKGKLGNPYLFSNLFMDPIYYPLEKSITTEPVSLPRIEIGTSMRNKNCCGGLGIEELLALFAAFKKRRPAPQPVYQPPPQVIYPPPTPSEPKKKASKISKKKGKRKFVDLNQQAIIPDNIKKKERKKIPIKRDWWKLCRDFCNIYAFFSTGKIFRIC